MDVAVKYREGIVVFSQMLSGNILLLHIDSLIKRLALDSYMRCLQIFSTRLLAAPGMHPTERPCTTTRQLLPLPFCKMPPTPERSGAPNM